MGTLTSGATGAGFTLALGTSTVSGVLPAVNGGAGTVSGILKANGSGTVSAASAPDFPTLNQDTTGNAATVTGLSVASGKTLTASNTLTLAGTDGSTL